MSRYLILGLPRSRTAWLSVAMTYGPSFCYHDPLNSCVSIEELKEKFDKTNNKFVGGADTSAVLFLDKIINTMPDIKILVIDRATEDCKKSAKEMGLPELDLSIIEDAMDKAKQMSGIKVVDYKNLDNPETGAEIWEFLIGPHPFNKERWLELNKLNIQLHIPHFVRRIHKDMGSVRTLLEEY